MVPGGVRRGWWLGGLARLWPRAAAMPSPDSRCALGGVPAAGVCGGRRSLRGGAPPASGSRSPGARLPGADWPGAGSPSRSDAVRVRRTGRSPVARPAAARAGRVGAGRELALQGAPLVGVGDAGRAASGGAWGRRVPTPPVPSRPARPWRPGPPGRSPCAAGGPRRSRAGGAGPVRDGPRSRRRTSRASRARARRRPRRRRRAEGSTADSCGTGRPYEEAADRGEGDHVGGDAEARARFVDRAEPVEVGAAEAVARCLQRGGPGRRRVRRRSGRRTTPRPWPPHRRVPRWGRAASRLAVGLSAVAAAPAWSAAATRARSGSAAR